MLVIASLGQSLVIGTGGIDLSVSSVITVVGVVFVIQGGTRGGSITLAIVYALLIGLACGVTNGLLVEYLHLSPLVTTLATGRGDGRAGQHLVRRWHQRPDRAEELAEVHRRRLATASATCW